MLLVALKVLVNYLMLFGMCNVVCVAGVHTYIEFQNAVLLLQYKSYCVKNSRLRMHIYSKFKFSAV